MKCFLDKRKLLETTVALELLKHGKQIAYQQNGSECDFVVIDKGKVINTIQVAADFMEQKTKEREGVKITILPAWRYFFV